MPFVCKGSDVRSFSMALLFSLLVVSRLGRGRMSLSVVQVGASSVL